MAIPVGSCIALAVQLYRNRAANLSQFSVVFKHGGAVFTLYLYSKYSGRNLHRALGTFQSDLIMPPPTFSPSPSSESHYCYHTPAPAQPRYTPHNVQPGAAINQCPSSGLISCYPW